MDILQHGVADVAGGRVFGWLSCPGIPLRNPFTSGKLGVPDITFPASPEPPKITGGQLWLPVSSGYRVRPRTRHRTSAEPG
ncbi:hypothetical protein GCM10010214_38160 [Streptomyces abikoensis]|nr:hypothetical protein GCM10010214_38160 [Streptomyces abikoensis]